MIPRVQTWTVSVYDGSQLVTRFEMDGPNKALIRIGVRMDYPRYWGKRLAISPKRRAK